LRGKTAIRAGGGIYYSDGQFGGLYAAQTNIGQNFSLTQKNVPGLTYPFTPFLGAAAFSISYSGKDRHRKDVTVQQWTFSIQQEIAHTMLQVGTSGLGTHLFRKDSRSMESIPSPGKRPYASLTNSIAWTTDDVTTASRRFGEPAARPRHRTSHFHHYQWSMELATAPTER
jgi:hypothetical protein